MTLADVSQRAPPPLSVAQEALWYVALLAPAQTPYNETVSFRKDGPFDVGAIRRAFNEIVHRHEAWRTTFDTVGGEPVQIVAPAPHFDLPVIDLSHLTREQAERRCIRLVGDTASVPYDIRLGPLLRPRLIRFAEDHHRLYLAMHHLIFDGVSVSRVVLPELIALYEAFSAGRPSPLSEPRARYEDYARWEQQWITEPRLARRLRYWREHLVECPTLQLPLDHPRPAAPLFRGGVLTLSVSSQSADRLRAVGQSLRATLFQVFAATWSVLLGRYSGQAEVVFGTAADLRQRPEFESVVGYCLTPVALRIDLSGDPPFNELVVRCRNELLDGLDHLVPFERVVREVPHDGASSANPIYQTMLVHEPFAVVPDSSWSIDQSEVGDAVGSSKLDLELELDERPDGHIAGRLIYDAELFERTTAMRIVDHWLRLVDAAAADPELPVSQLPILTPAEQQRQLAEWNATAIERPQRPVHELIDARSERQPDAPAVSIGECTLQYEELVRRAHGIAAQLARAGVTAGDAVAVCGELSAELVVASLGALAAGAGVSLHPGAPAGQGSLITVEGADGVRFGVERGDLGSLALRHAGAVNLAAAVTSEVDLSPDDTALVLPLTAWHASVVALWMPLIAGARIVLAPAEIADDGAAISRLIADEKVTFMHAAPSQWQALIDTGLRAARGLRALSGGGRLSADLADAILERCRVLWNAHGSQATGGYCTLARVQRPGPVALGRPIANTRVYVLDAHDQHAPVGVTGDLVVAGDGVASVLMEAAAPRQRNGCTMLPSAADPSDPRIGVAQVIDDPAGAGLAVRTDDRVRWRADGQLEVAPEPYAA